MTAILYPLKMDKDLTKVYSSIYEAKKKDTKDMKDYLDKKAKTLTKEDEAQPEAYRNNPAFNKTSPNSKDPAVAKSRVAERQFEGKFRKEWEAFKLIEKEDYIERFKNWKNGLVEEGYDISRWTEEDLVETFIIENDLFSSQDSVIEALLESDKKGKGSGTKDACYHKVKSRYSVWPSAYASGALVKCRKKGAKNWGNSSKKEDFSDWRSDINLNEILEKGAKGKIEFHSGRSDKENKQVMKTKRKTVNNPKGRKIHQSPMGKTIGKLQQVKNKQYDAEKKGDTKAANKAFERRKKLSGTLYDKTGSFHDRADND